MIWVIIASFATSEDGEVVDTVHYEESSEDNFVVVAKMDGHVDCRADPRPASTSVSEIDEELSSSGDYVESSE